MLEDYNTIKENKLSGRYINIESILPLIIKAPFEKSILGYSFLNKPIYKIQIGDGEKKILIWSQMHGNESTGTKAVFDLINLFERAPEYKKVLSLCTIVIVPMLNPDGANQYTRFNAQEIDLNRDAVALKAPESILLNTLLHQFKPDYCFNLHDQRPIFSVGKDNLPATISFLSPSVNMERTITNGRKETMSVIVAMNKAIQPYIPNQVGRYTDEFYPTATGDNFQKAGFNTILIESGHYINDYQREETRKYTFLSLITGIEYISTTNQLDYKAYFDIPNNEKKYVEILLNNVVLNAKKVKIGIYLEDKLDNGVVVFVKKHQVLDFSTTQNSNRTIHKELIFSSEEELSTYIRKFL